MKLTYGRVVETALGTVTLGCIVPFFVAISIEKRDYAVIFFYKVSVKYMCDSFIIIKGRSGKAVFKSSPEGGH